jgi:hypothetical protein
LAQDAAANVERSGHFCIALARTHSVFNRKSIFHEVNASRGAILYVPKAALTACHVTLVAMAIPTRRLFHPPIELDQ